MLLDGDQVRRHVKKASGKSNITERDIWDFANCCVRAPDEDLFRIYYYDCPPYDKKEVHPITKVSEDFANSATAIARRAFNERLSRMDHIAFRSGELSFKGWTITRNATADLINTGRAIQARDISPDFEQKRVDMKIGLDVAWLSSKRIVDRIVLVTADSDFIPAMKFARREGVQVVLVRLDLRMKQEMLQHADEVRTVVFPPAPAAVSSL